MREWPNGLYANWIDFEGYELVVTSRYAVALSDEQVDDLIDTLIEHRTLSRPT